MHIKKALAAFRSQRNAAKQRGIEFKLSFQQWCDFWGDDIDRRGSGRENLQMQRYGDLGAYEIGNIKKGTPKQNSITAAIVGKTRSTAKDGKELQSRIDAMMFEQSCDVVEQSEDELEMAHLGIKSSFDRRYTFVV